MDVKWENIKYFYKVLCFDFKKSIDIPYLKQV